MKRKHIILPLALLALLFASCDKDNGATPQDTNALPSYEEQDWSWDKQQGGGFQMDTAWNNDTTIKF